MNTVSDYISGNADKTNPLIIQMHGAASIPVGHRIEIHIYLLGGLGLFGTGTPKPQFEYPLITDLETGIQYGDMFQFYELVDKAYKDNQLFEAQTIPLENLQEHSNFRGKILACNVLTNNRNNSRLQTTLLIEPENG